MLRACSKVPAVLGGRWRRHALGRNVALLDGQLTLYRAALHGKLLVYSGQMPNAPRVRD